MTRPPKFLHTCGPRVKFELPATPLQARVWKRAYDNPLFKLVVRAGLEAHRASHDAGPYGEVRQNFIGETVHGRTKTSLMAIRDDHFYAAQSLANNMPRDTPGVGVSWVPYMILRSISTNIFCMWLAHFYDLHRDNLPEAHENSDVKSNSEIAELREKMGLHPIHKETWEWL